MARGSAPRPSRRPRSRGSVPPSMRIGASSQGRNWLSSSAAGRMNRILLRSEPDRDLADDRELAVGGDAVDVLRRDRGVVDHDARGLGAGAARGRTDVVDRRGRHPGQRGDVVEQPEQPGAHGGKASGHDRARASSPAGRTMRAAPAIDRRPRPRPHLDGSRSGRRARRVELDGLLDVPLGVAERVDRRGSARGRPAARRAAARDRRRPAVVTTQRDRGVVVGPAHVAGVLGALDDEAVEQVDDQRGRAHPGEPAADPRHQGQERPGAERADDAGAPRGSAGHGRRRRRARRTASGSRATRSAPACRSRWSATAMARKTTQRGVADPRLAAAARGAPASR